eukprot:3474791-Amphidinium_carterae.1
MFTDLSTISTLMVRFYCEETASPFGKPYGRYDTYLWVAPQADDWCRHSYAIIANTEPPTVFEKTTKGTDQQTNDDIQKLVYKSTTYYLCLEKPKLQEILDNLKTQVITTVADTYIDDRLSEEGFHYEEGLKRTQRKHARLLAERNAEKKQRHQGNCAATTTKRHSS